jgi:serine protease Do
MVRLFIYVIAGLCVGCSNRARSQEQVVPTSVQDESTTLSKSNSVSVSRQNAITRAVQAATPAIVSINVIELQRLVYRHPFSALQDDPLFRRLFADQERVRQVQNLGSGFIISPDGYIVTNDHVAGGANRITVSLNDGRTLEAQLVGSDAISDLALVKVDSPEPLPYLSFAENHTPIVGEWAIALGNPFGLFEATEPSVTVGVVSAVNRDLGREEDHFYYDMIQTDASINRGNSGGPLVNALGDVIGVNTAIYSEGGGSIGLGFAVPSAKAERIVEELRTKGEVNRAYYSGLRFQRITDDIVADKQLQTMRGVLVAVIDPGSPADQAGFLIDDIVIAVEGELVSDFDDYRARIFDFLPGDVLSYLVVRNGQHIELSMRIAHQES